MRQALVEYDFDWSMQKVFEQASRMHDGTAREFRRAKSRFNFFIPLIDQVYAYPEVGKAFTKGAGSYVNNIINAHKEGKKLALTTFCMSPAICYAMDVVPLLIEPMTAIGSLSRKHGTGEFMDYCVEIGFTETACSGQRGAMGAYFAGAAAKPDFVLSNMSGICDTNTAAFSFASEFLDIPMFQLNFPPNLRDSRSDEYQRRDYRAMIAFMEEQTGTALDEDNFREVLNRVREQDEMLVEMRDLQRLKPNPLPGIFDLFSYIARFLMAGTQDCTDALKIMLDHAKENARNGKSGLKNGEEKARALFVYTDHYSMGVPLWAYLEERGVSHLGCIADRHYQADACYCNPGDGYSIDTTNLDAMIDSMAAINSRMPMVKQIRGPYDAPGMWLEELKTYVNVFSPDCAVYMGTPGCRNTWGMIKLVARELEKMGVPTLILNCDAFDDRVESWGMTQARLGEFLDIRRIGK